MKILLIGSNGKIGTAILKKFDKNHIIFSPPKEKLDINNINQINKINKDIKPDIIINTAAYHHLPSCEQNVNLAYKINVEGNRNLLKVSSDNNILYVTFSTDYVFDGFSKKAYTENDLTNPIQIYGKTKNLSERECMLFYPEKSIIIRTSGVFGNSFENKKKNFLLNRLDDSKFSKKIEISSEQIISPTFSDDIAIILQKIIFKENVTNGIFHIVNSEDCSWFELAVYFLKKMGISKKIFPVDRKGIDNSGFMRPVNSVLSNKKIKSLTKINIPTWKEAVDEYVKLL